MTKQEQIEEIKRVLISVYGRIRTISEDCINNRQAEALYNAGYRQGERIMAKIKVFRTNGQSLEEVLNTIGYENVLDIVSEHCFNGAIINVIYKESPKVGKQAEVEE